MHYVFVINGRSDKAGVELEVRRQLEGSGISHEIYVTRGVGDATRYVNLYCDLGRYEEICFVACGGTGTANEVASAVVRHPGACMAFLALDGTCDYVKCWPDRDFSSLDAILAGEPLGVDVMKVGDNYAINSFSVGMDSMSAELADRYNADGVPDAYRRGVTGAVLRHRFNRFTVTVDGSRVGWGMNLLASVFNGSWYGGQFHAAPDADPCDGLLDVVVMRSMLLTEVALMMDKYRSGAHMTSPFCLRRMECCRGRHVELSSRDLMYASLDGEIFASTRFSVDILPGALTIILPAPKK